MAEQEAVASPDALVLHLQGFEGPLDLLLDLARQRKLDLATISIAELVDQFLAVVEGARRVRLELAADWLVMAAWLAWLKSRLLLPAGEEGAEEAEQQAERLASRLRDLARVRQLAEWLGQQPQLGQDVFARGAPEEMVHTDRSQIRFDMPALLRAFLSATRRGMGSATYRPAPRHLWTVQQALERLQRLVGSLPSWSTLTDYLPAEITSPIERRGALASALIAGLEMARSGQLELRQEDAFGPIRLNVTAGGQP